MYKHRRRASLKKVDICVLITKKYNLVHCFVFVPIQEFIKKFMVHFLLRHWLIFLLFCVGEIIANVRERRRLVHCGRVMYRPQQKIVCSTVYHNNGY